MMPLPEAESFARIKVIGVGGGGSNAVTRMIRAEVRGIEFIAVNTDAQALVRADADRKLHMGDKLTKGLGAGGDPQKGMKAAEETSDQLYDALKDSDMVFITAGMGGGTGSGASPVIAQIAQEVGALTVGIVTRPFTWEGAKRKRIADEAIAQLHDKVDTLIVIPNDHLMAAVDQNRPFEQSFQIADEVLHQGIQGIAEIITVPGLINVDFADVKAIMSQSGSALMAIGRGSGEQRASEAAKAAISSPLLEGSINGARGLLFNITGGSDMTLHEVTDAAGIISEAADPDANIIFGAVIDPRLEGEIKITAVATGFEGAHHAGTRSFPSLASSGLPRFPQLPREPSREEGEESDIPSFIPRRRPLPEFLEALRSNESRGKRRRLVGFVNPTLVYPAPLVAIVVEGGGAVAVYPDGYEENCAVPAFDERHPATAVVQTAPGLPLEIGPGDLLYGLSPTDIVAGPEEHVSAELLSRLEMGLLHPELASEVREFLQRDTASEIVGRTGLRTRVARP